MIQIIGINGYQLMVLSSDMRITGWTYITGYLPNVNSTETHSFGAITSLLIQGFFWRGPYTELEVQIWLNDVLKDNPHWAAGENGGFVPYAYFPYAMTHIIIKYYSYFGEGNPPDVSYMGYCEWP